MLEVLDDVASTEDAIVFFFFYILLSLLQLTKASKCYKDWARGGGKIWGKNAVTHEGRLIEEQANSVGLRPKPPTH